jgi:hypothetical protein
VPWTISGSGDPPSLQRSYRYGSNMFLMCSYLSATYPNAARLLEALPSSALIWWRQLHKTVNFLGAIPADFRAGSLVWFWICRNLERRIMVMAVTGLEIEEAIRGRSCMPDHPPHRRRAGWRRRCWQ